MKSVILLSQIFVINLLFIAIIAEKEEIVVKSVKNEMVDTDTFSSTKSPENNTCEHVHGSCSDCIDFSKSCYYCSSTKSCYTNDALGPPKKCKSLDDTSFLVCLMNLKVFIIVISVLGGSLILSIIICCCCCCCRKKNGSWLAKQEAKWARERESRKLKADERKLERQARTDEIRRKYGLLLDASGLIKDDNPYRRFDA